jgi:hypothetical protein
MKIKTYQLIETKSVFVVTLLVIVITVLGVYFWGLGYHHTFYENSMISTSVLSVVFFLFITVGLYQGMKLKDNIGKIKTADIQVPSSFDFSPPGDGIFVFADDILGAVVGVIAWILFAFFLVLLLWIFSNVVMIVIATFMAMLYWIFFRALRLVFKNSNKSKGKLMESIRYGLLYTFLYNFWIYGILMTAEYFNRH